MKPRIAWALFCVSAERRAQNSLLKLSGVTASIPVMSQPTAIWLAFGAKGPAGTVGIVQATLLSPDGVQTSLPPAHMVFKFDHYADVNVLLKPLDVSVAGEYRVRFAWQGEPEPDYETTLLVLPSREPRAGSTQTTH